MYKCPKCSSMFFSPTCKFCPNCGTETTKTTLDEFKAEPVKLEKCGACGTEIFPSYNFCIGCGRPVNNDAKALLAEARKNRR
ncbi:MAG: hypothetical protein V1763_00610 [Parcubacteria group bacterium]